MPTPERSTLATSPATTAFPPSSTAKSQRVLACVQCQQRKVKCDRKFPCANCVKSHAQCVPAASLGARQRRRRFPERELLDRLSRYEALLRQNDIKFDPLHSDPSTIEKQSRHDSPDDERPGAAAGPDRSSSTSTTGKPETVYEAKNFWHAMNQRSQDSDDDDNSDSSLNDVRETMVKKAWIQLYQSNEHLLFGSRKAAVDLSTLHPEQVQIFRLWQIYLDNVNPLLKVTHTPTLQSRIIDAASNLANIKPTLSALMFSIYCVSVLSLAEDECRAMFASSREHLLTRYQFGCQQALLDCGFLRSADRECLTALYLYLISIRPTTDPQSISSMLSIATRIAQRMGLHSESANAKCLALEAEMRRRLWWSLILFDTRICEIAACKSVLLVPTWDCKTPLNVNDFDLQPEMKDPPMVQGESTEALFAVVRSEVGEFVRHCAFHLDFTIPALKTIVKDVRRDPVPDGGELATLEKMIEDKYLRFCNPENPLHFMTIWTARGQLAKNRLIETYSKFSTSSVPQTDAQRDDAISYALKMLECDTKLMNSPLTKGYLWLVEFHFQFTAYMHLTQDLRRRPVGDHTEQAWETMSENYEARFMCLGENNNPLFKIFAKVVLQAWEAREALFSQSEKSLVPPRIVSNIRQKVAQPIQDAQNANVEQPNDVLGMSIDDFSMSMPMDFCGHGMLYGIGGQSYDGSGTGQGQAALDLDVSQLNWNAMDWNPIHGRGW
ncbi:hypothetical protein AOQ84DRAFT_309716 [Glonium stellatum]|uniref:Zn(2)-C6 fungal-type domain-containing protein n=1 Tax=Glonium stellatum TaxID=574774 RepID=A0A8E2FB84_9PEZI|nr:hypothetical protein AOQ84DRAFT_309716 [Glonium stellatum]